MADDLRQPVDEPVGDRHEISLHDGALDRPPDAESGFQGWIAGVEPRWEDECVPDWNSTSRPSIDDAARRRALIGCVIPAYNEEDSIRQVLDSLLAQTLLPDEIHVVVNNSTDATVAKCRPYLGTHEREFRGETVTCAIYVHDIGKNAAKKVGALNYGYKMVEAFDYFVGVDGDTIAPPETIEQLYDEISSDPTIGGVSALYSIDETLARTPVASWLVAGQRAQFASFHLKAMTHKRNVAVLGGQFSMFSIDALQTVMEEQGQETPWVTTSEIEDSLLSLQIRSAGYQTKVSETARANVGPMLTIRALDGQQVKWNAGAVDLIRRYPFHACCRQRWAEHISMFFNSYNRFAFLFLLISSIALGAFRFFPIWLIPPLASVLLNLRVCFKMGNRSVRDVIFAATFFPAELYLIIRIMQFLRSWWKATFGKRGDNWAAQARAEKGRGRAYLVPYAVCLVLLLLCLIIQFSLPTSTQTLVLWYGWATLAVLTAIQTLFMLIKIVRPYGPCRV